MVEAGVSGVTSRSTGSRPRTTAMRGVPGSWDSAVRGAASGPRRGRQGRLQHADQPAYPRRAAAAARAARRRGHPLVAAADHGAARQRRRPPGDHPAAVHDFLELFEELEPVIDRCEELGSGCGRPTTSATSARSSAAARRCAPTGAAARRASRRWASTATAASRTARASAVRSTSAATGASTASRDLWRRATSSGTSASAPVDDLWGYCRDCYYADVHGRVHGGERAAARAPRQQPVLPPPRADAGPRGAARAHRAGPAAPGESGSITGCFA
jgi:hypothetical protein